MREETFAEIVAVIERAHGVTLEPETQRIWWGLLKDLGDGEAMGATVELCRESRFPPKPADVWMRATAPAVSEEDRDAEEYVNASDGWNEILGAADAEGDYVRVDSRFYEAAKDLSNDSDRRDGTKTIHRVTYWKHFMKDLDYPSSSALDAVGGLGKIREMDDSERRFTRLEFIKARRMYRLDSERLDREDGGDSTHHLRPGRKQALSAPSVPALPSPPENPGGNSQAVKTDMKGTGR